MSRIILNSELLNKVFDGKEISREDAYEIYLEAQRNPHDLHHTAQILRNKNKGKLATYSRKVFFNLINLCRDTCSYCTYKVEPGDSKISMMGKSEIAKLIEIGKKFKCTEALFVTGERPEQRYGIATDWLKANGYSSTAEYLIYASETALKEGLFPHTNAGNLTKAEMAGLKKSNASIGLMLENSSPRLSQKGMPHEFAPSKNPRARIRTLENAGSLSIPTTTGLLIGIGESPYESIDSLFEIKSIHQRYHNIQEIIVQNFQPKPGTPMSGAPQPDEKYFKNVVSLARLIMPEMNIQIPPNLSPHSYAGFLNSGINDWGGISPITPDYVNPEFPWPSIDTVERNCNMAGFELRARFPTYPEFFPMVDTDVRSKMLEIADSERLVSEDYQK
ncbi:MAG: 7,8-didemethyl-8-hydroxy-5-deazariboflavin synthase subunit CofG [Thaumarchaeota archaeon]|nr:7,8-didemethyl-8-hydroxy-5-deazariboflavin synthase subunit CofG [Nitrososphaerota archaeon]